LQTSFANKFKSYQTEVATRTQPSRPRTLKKSEAKDRKARGQGQGLEDTFENRRKCKCKHCNYDFTDIQT